MPITAAPQQPRVSRFEEAPAFSFRALTPRVWVGLACLCAAAGLLTIHGAVSMLGAIWRDDDLKSMGLLIPFVCAALILREWRRLGWEADGTWWGFALFAAAAVLMFIRSQTLLIVLVHGDWSLQLPPLPLVAVVYAASLVLLFGGMKLLRAAWFPVLLMWAVIPVPQTFSSAIDLPLQYAAAHVARLFAHAIGVPLTADRLRVLFSPDYAFFVAPGCNGIRGAVTLGLSALVVSYVYRFRWFVFAPAVAGAVLMGYAFNFLRLCLLVVYYRIAVPYPWLRSHSNTADYMTGGTLFVIALCLFFAVANRFRRDAADVLPPQPELPAQRTLTAPQSRSFVLKVGAVLALSAVFGMDLVHEARAKTYNLAQPVPDLPASIGDWKRVRTWNDETLIGLVVYKWAEYAAPPAADGTPGPHVSLGVSPKLSMHDAELCHVARGEDHDWHGPMSLPTAAGTVNFAGSLYNTGRTLKLEAATVCQGGTCGQVSAGTQRITLVMARPEGRLPLEQSRGQVPVLIKVETPETTLPTNTALTQLDAQIAAFVQKANLPAITEPFSHRR